MSNEGVVLVPSSFRDPDGYVFYKNNILYRTVAESYRENYDLLNTSGLYKKLFDLSLLIPHVEAEKFPDIECYKILRPEQISFVSYVYEWSFDQLRDAALLVLKIQEAALSCGMTLKDSTTFNVQFKGCKPVWIDTLSFVKYREGSPWLAYKQFCEHFLAPLALMSYKDPRLNGLLKNHLDGIPLDLTSKLLPVKSKLNLGIAMHIHLHAKSQKRYSEKAIDFEVQTEKFSAIAFKSLIENLHSTISNLNSPKDAGLWQHYYNDLELSPKYLPAKTKFVDKCCEFIKPGFVWDLGANSGLFSEISSLKNSFVVSADLSHDCIDRLYRDCKKKNIRNILPLIIDLVNPSPALGWTNTERPGVFSRGKADVVMALALIHHLAITNNIPLEKIALWMSSLAKNLIIEFVPKDDPNAMKLLRSREDIFKEYDQQNFEIIFSRYFTVKDKEQIAGTERIIYFMQRITN